MPISAKQLNFHDISINFDKFYNQKQNTLLSLLDEFININDFIPFFSIKIILYITTIELLIPLLHISSKLRKFCGFLKVSDKSQFSRFKSNSFDNLNDLFNNLVDYTEDFSQKINPFLSSILITDTTRIEAYITENNPKFYQSELGKTRAYPKIFAKYNSNSNFDVEKYAQGQMPKYANSNTNAKLAYLRCFTCLYFSISCID